MRTLLALASVSISLLALPGCPLGCSAYSGGSDQVFQRGSNDVIIFCEPDGTFVERLDGQAEVAGFAEVTSAPAQGGDTITATVNGTTTVAFTWTEDTAGDSGAAPELGSGTFTRVNLDQVDLDHANTLCVQLESQPWYAQGGPQ